MAFEVKGAGWPDANGTYLNTGKIWKGKPVFKNASGVFLSCCTRSGCSALAGWGIRKEVDHGTVYIHTRSEHAHAPPVEGWSMSGLGLEVVEQPPAPTVHPVSFGLKRHRHSAGDILGRAWKHRKFSDAEILCAGVRTAVHRVTLASASPVFDAAFSSTMSEGQTAVYEIKEATPAAVEAMLAYIYTGTLECPCAELTGLLDLAVQYELGDLGIEIAQRLTEDVTVENVRARCLTLKRHNERPFAAAALKDIIKFIKDDAEDQLILAAFG